MKEKILTVIPARGGSVGVPRKNLIPLAGKPLIAYTIESALAAGVIDRLVVSTEDEEIATIARKFGAETLERPIELAGNEVLTEPVMAHVLEKMEGEGYVPDFISLIQCTSPFLSPDVIREAVNRVAQNGFDSCITAYKPHGFEFKWRKDERDPDAFAPDHDVESRPRRQDLPPLYHENGAFYITRTEFFKKTQNRFGGSRARITAVLMSEEESLQIDNEVDLRYAEDFLRERRKA